MYLLIHIHSGEIVGIRSGFKYLHYLADGIAVGIHGCCAAGHKPFLTIFLLKVHDSPACTESELGIPLVLDDGSQIMHHDVVYLRRP